MLCMAPGCELEVERGPDWLLVRVQNLEFLESETPFCEHLWGLLQQHFTYRLVLELDDIEVLTSHLIGQLIQLHRRIEEHDGVLRLCGLSPQNRAAMCAAHLDELLTSYNDRREALLGRPCPSKPR
jgi:hypothetical protein